MTKWYLQMKNIQSIVDFFVVNKNFFETIMIIALSSIALYTDIKSYKIPNKLNLTFIILGLSFNLIIGNFKSGIIGMIFPMIMFPLFALRLIGAGDIKLFCALGAIATFPHIINIMAYSIILNGIIAVALLVIRKQYRTFKNLFNWIKCCIISRTIMKYQVLDSKSKSSFRYAYGIALGCVYYIFSTIWGGGTYAIL